MISYDLENNYDEPLRLILEPDASEYDLPPNEHVTITVSGDGPAFVSRHFQNKDGIQCISFWPHKGVFEIRHHGRSLH